MQGASARARASRHAAGHRAHAPCRTPSSARLQTVSASECSRLAHAHSPRSASPSDQRSPTPHHRRAHRPPAWFSMAWQCAVRGTGSSRRGTSGTASAAARCRQLPPAASYRPQGRTACCSRQPSRPPSPSHNNKEPCPRRSPLSASCRVSTTRLVRRKGNDEGEKKSRVPSTKVQSVALGSLL